MRCVCFFFSSRGRHTRYIGDWSSDVCSSDLKKGPMLSRLDYLERTQWRSLDELVALQSGALRQLVRHAYRDVASCRAQIGRASCRGGGWDAGAEGAWARVRQEQHQTRGEACR